MSKEEYLALAAARFDELKGLKKHEDFYSYEAEFDFSLPHSCAGSSSSQRYAPV